MKFYPYGRQDISTADEQRVLAVLHSDFLTQGPEIKRFEDHICTLTGARYAVAFNSATSALHGAYFALGLGPDQELLTTGNTFVATANGALYLGATPTFCEVEADTGNMDPNALANTITNKTSVVVPVHYSGQPCDMEEICEIAKAKGAGVVEDASHAIGASYQQEFTGRGSYSDISVFSFHPVKIATSGEGGVATTQSEELYQRMMQFRTHGITRDNLQHPSPGPWYYEMQHLGFNYRLTDLQAALGDSQLDRLPYFIDRRNAIALQYHKYFSGIRGITPLTIRPNRRSAYHLYPLLLADELIPHKAAIIQKLRTLGIGTQVHYIPVYSQPYYQQNVVPTGFDLPITTNFYQKELSIPMYTTLTDEDVQYIAKTITQTIKSFLG